MTAEDILKQHLEFLKATITANNLKIKSLKSQVDVIKLAIRKASGVV